MNLQDYIFVFLISVPIMSMSQEKHVSDSSYQDVMITRYAEPPDPPFKEEQISHFETIADWLDNICKSQQPNKEIAIYKFWLFEAPDNNVLCLVGLNSYPWKDGYVTKVDFKPVNMYLKLSVNQYNGLNRGDFKEKIYLQLREFTNTEEFKKSFLSKANLITTAFGTDIWSKTP
jgi:hypothetical protein